MKADYHVHTIFSDDSEYLMEQVVRDAIAKGINEICFTDHVDYGIKKDWDESDGVEINTSCHRYGLKDLTPSRDILKLYHDLGGRVITIGSDSHKPEHLGAYIDEAKEELKRLGFEEFCTFDRMEPVYHIL